MPAPKTPWIETLLAELNRESCRWQGSILIIGFLSMLSSIPASGLIGTLSPSFGQFYICIGISGLVGIEFDYYDSPTDALGVFTALAFTWLIGVGLWMIIYNPWPFSLQPYPGSRF